MSHHHPKPARVGNEASSAYGQTPPPTVRGHIEEVSDPAECDRRSGTPVVAWAPGAKAHYVRVTPGLVSGPRIEH